MKKTVLSLLALLLLFCLLTACGNSGIIEPDVTAVPSDAPAAPGELDTGRLKEAMLDKLTEPLELTAESINELYFLDAADVTNAFGFTAMGGVFPDELIVVQATDDAAKARITEKLEERLADVKEQSRSYDEENFALAQSCRVLEKDLWVVLFLSPQHEAMEQDFFACFETVQED